MSKSIKIGDFLEERNKLTNRGICKTCKKNVYWAANNLASHKRVSCTISERDKKMWNDLKQESKEVVIVADLPTNAHDKQLSGNSALPSKITSYTDSISQTIITLANKALAKLVFRCAIPFRVIDAPAFKTFIKILKPSYLNHLVCANTLSTTYLDAEYEEGMKKIKKIIADCDGYVIVSDGWTNINRQHLVSFIIYVRGSKPFFYKIVDTSSFHMNAQKNAQLIMDIAIELDDTKWLAVVTDNAPVLQAAWKIIETKYPRVLANGCMAHGLNSFMNDIYNRSELLQERLRDALFLIKQVHYHTRLNQEFESIRKRHAMGVRLQNPVPTRFASEYLAADSVLSNKSTFYHLIDEMEELVSENLGPKAQRFRDIIGNPQFWADLRYIVKELFMKLANAIKLVEGDDVNIGIVYELFLDLKEHVETLPLNSMIQKDEIVDAFEERWTKLDFDCMGFAHVLCPSKLVDNRMSKEDYLRTIKSLKKYIRDFFLEDMGRTNGALNDLNEYFKFFEGKTKDFVNKEYDEEPSAFWAVFGRKMFPQLSIIASRLYHIVPSSAASERGWNVFSQIHTKKRNRLSSSKVEKLAFVYINAALLDEEDNKDYFLNNDDFDDEHEENDCEIVK